MKFIGPKAKDADLWILIWEELHEVRQEGLLEVELNNASRQGGGARTDVDDCVTERNTRADELAKTWSDVGW